MRVNIKITFTLPDRRQGNHRPKVKNRKPGKGKGNPLIAEHYAKGRELSQAGWQQGQTVTLKRLNETLQARQVTTDIL